MYRRMRVSSDRSALQHWLNIVWLVLLPHDLKLRMSKEDRGEMSGDIDPIAQGTLYVIVIFRSFTIPDYPFLIILTSFGGSTLNFQQKSTNITVDNCQRGLVYN